MRASGCTSVQEKAKSREKCGRTAFRLHRDALPLQSIACRVLAFLAFPSACGTPSWLDAQPSGLAFQRITNTRRTRVRWRPQVPRLSDSAIA
jgi:hypothetical protein